MRMSIRLRFLAFLAVAALLCVNGRAAFCESEADALHPMRTLDHTAYGVSMKIVDFQENTAENEFLMNKSGARQRSSDPGLLSAFLGEDGYPMNQAGVSMATLFSEAEEVNHLFLEEPFLNDGILTFDSTQCFASYQYDGTFLVWWELGTVDSERSETLDHGQFLPFNDLMPGVFSSIHPINIKDALGEELPDSDPRKGERLYKVAEKETDYYFGLEMELQFMFPAGGMNERGEELIAYFSGDDDLWVYIDDELVIDLGGIHSAIDGSINFSTGKVTCRGANGMDSTISLYKVFQNNYEKEYPELKAREIEARLAEIFHEDKKWQKVFYDNSVHTLRLFYLERGAGAANLHIELNMPLMK